MKTRLNYEPWKITVGEQFAENVVCQSAMGIVQQVGEGIKKWRRFPFEYGADATANCVFVLLDRIATPLALLDPKMSFSCKCEKIRARELPKSLRELHRHLVILGHAGGDTDTAPEKK